MSGPLDIWRQAAAKWSAVYGQVTESQWERPTPCDEWTVRQLVDHTLSWQAEGGRQHVQPTVGDAQQAKILLLCRP